MNMWIPILMMVLVGGFVLRLWHRSRKQRRIAALRRVELPNSAYSSLGVRNLEDRERWGEILLPALHPLNQEEVERLLYVVDSNGIFALSRKDRLFLDNMTMPRMG